MVCSFMGRINLLSYPLLSTVCIHIGTVQHVTQLIINTLRYMKNWDAVAVRVP